MWEIRRYEAADHQAVWDLHNLALAGTGAHAGSGPRDNDLHDVERQYLDSGEFLVATDGGRLVGMGALRPVSERVAEVERMRVDPEFQRRGLGTALLGRLEAKAKQLGYVQLDLDTTEEQVPAQRLYVANGYVEVARDAQHGFSVIHYSKLLPAL